MPHSKDVSLSNDTLPKSKITAQHRDVGKFFRTYRRWGNREKRGDGGSEGTRKKGEKKEAKEREREGRREKKHSKETKNYFPPKLF